MRLQPRRRFAKNAIGRKAPHLVSNKLATGSSDGTVWVERRAHDCCVGWNFAVAELRNRKSHS